MLEFMSYALHWISFKWLLNFAGILVVAHLMVSELRPSTLTSGNVPNGHPSAEIIRQCPWGSWSRPVHGVFCRKNTGKAPEDEVYSFLKWDLRKTRCTFEGFSVFPEIKVYIIMYTISLRFYRILDWLMVWLERIPQAMVQKRRRLILEGIGVPSKTLVMERRTHTSVPCQWCLEPSFWILVPTDLANKKVQKNESIEMCGKKFSDLFDSKLICRCFFSCFSLILCGSLLVTVRPGLTRRSELPRVGETHGPWANHGMGIALAFQWLSDFTIIWGFPKRMVPPKHPKCWSFFRRKTHGCWVPPF